MRGMATKGPEPKLTSDTHAVIVDAVANGVPYKHAAAKAGISERSLLRWLAWGKAGKEPFASLVAALKRVEANYIQKHLKTITDASYDSWQAAAWILERRHPEEFGSNRHEIAELKKAVAQLSKAQSGGDNPKPAAVGAATEAKGRKRIGGDDGSGK